MHLPHTSCSTSFTWLQGRPIYIQHLGAIDLKRIYELTTEERMLKFHVQEYERCLHVIMPACSKAVGRHIEQTFAILDVKGEPVGCCFGSGAGLACHACPCKGPGVPH